MCSSSLLHTLVIAIGLYEAGSILSLPGFRIGDINWVFQSLGHLFRVNDCLKILVRVGDIVGARSLSKCGDKPSGPTDLFIFSPSSCDKKN